MDFCLKHIKEIICRSGEFLYPVKIIICVSLFDGSTNITFRILQKKKGTFQHSSFLAGGATSAAGRLVVENGVLKVKIN